MVGPHVVEAAGEHRADGGALRSVTMKGGEQLAGQGRRRHGVEWLYQIEELTCTADTVHQLDRLIALRVGWRAAGHIAR